jgi:hypothetical protein
VVFLAVRFFAEAIFFEKNGLTTAEVTNGNIYKSLENFAPLPALDLQGIRNGYVGCRQDLYRSTTFRSKALPKNVL